MSDSFALERPADTTDSRETQQASQDVPEAIRAMWESQRHEVISVRLRCKYLATSSHLAPLTPDQVRELLKAASSFPPPVRFAWLAQRLAAPEMRDNGPLGGDVAFTMDGDKRRVDTFLRGEFHDRFISDGTNVLASANGNKQVSVYSAGASKRGAQGLGDFRRIPRVPTDGVRVVNQGETLLLQFKAQELIIDKATGLMLLEAGRRANGFESFLVQRDPVVYPGDVVFPTFSLGVLFKNGTLFHATMTAIEDAEFNQPIPAETFRYDASAGTVVADFRGGRERPALLRAPSDVADMAAAIPQVAAAGRNWMLIGSLVIFTSLIVSLVVGLLWRRAKAA
ncbi:MAG: hypothetical protein HYX69_11095 [Planctomycetia bacterium]|nr:hypothetical protein [Planctomycetia bacterium]